SSILRPIVKDAQHPWYVYPTASRSSSHGKLFFLRQSSTDTSSLRPPSPPTPYFFVRSSPTLPISTMWMGHPCGAAGAPDHGGCLVETSNTTRQAVGGKNP